MNIQIKLKNVGLLDFLNLKLLFHTFFIVLEHKTWRIRDLLINNTLYASLGLYSNIMHYVEIEHFGWNRNLSETRISYAKRVWNDDYLKNAKDNLFNDNTFERVMKISDKCNDEDINTFFIHNWRKTQALK